MPLKSWLADRRPVVPGRHGLSLEAVRRSQRARLLIAVAELARDRGALGVTARRLCEHAGVSRTTLYDLYESKEECFLDAASEACERLLGVMAEANAPDPSSRARLEAVIDAFMRFCVEHPRATELCLLHLGSACDEGAALKQRLLGEMEALLRAQLRGAMPEAPDMTSEMLAGGLSTMAVKRLRDGQERRLPLLTAPLLHGWLGAARRSA